MIAFLVALGESICQVYLLFFSLFENGMILAHKVQVEEHFLIANLSQIFLTNLVPEVNKDFLGDRLWVIFEVEFRYSWGHHATVS